MMESRFRKILKACTYKIICINSKLSGKKLSPFQSEDYNNYFGELQRHERNFYFALARGEGAIAQSVERATSGEEVPGSTYRF